MVGSKKDKGNITQYLAMEKEACKLDRKKGNRELRVAFSGATQSNSRADLLPRPA